MKQLIQGVISTTATSTDKIKQNIQENVLSYDKLPEVHQLDEWRERVPIAVVGGGPSLAGELDRLRKYKYVLACGSVHDYLVENKIIPKWAAICDPDPVVNKYLKKWDYGTIYFIASQCDRATFEHLGHTRRVIFHVGSENLEYDLFGKDKIIVGGGCTIATRAMVLAIGMGFNHLHLFGMDTCLKNDKHHAYEFETKEESVGKINKIVFDEVIKGEFEVADYMLAQFFDFKEILKRYVNKIDIEIFGDGLLKSYFDALVKQAEETKLNLKR